MKKMNIPFEIMILLFLVSITICGISISLLAPSSQDEIVKIVCADGYGYFVFQEEPIAVMDTDQYEKLCN